MLTEDKKIQFEAIFEELVNNLDITEAQYNAAVTSYKNVGTWLSDENCILTKYNPEILPQGSFLLGTVIKPVNENDDLDIDLVCELTGKDAHWAQADVKNIVGDRIKEHQTYLNLLDHEGRRCWTLKYRRNSEYTGDKYHMDILPAIISEGYNLILEKAFSQPSEDVDNLAIRITDKETTNYYTDTEMGNWLKSNPFGYAQWFNNKATLSETRFFSLNESIRPVPTYQKEKLPLQRAVQILKRHRDIMFNGDEHKPISVIITTLAAKSYNKETNLITALANIISTMESHIEDRFDIPTGKMIKYVANPVNEDENFADKWVEYPIRQKNFFDWLDTLKSDFNNILSQANGIQNINEAMQKPFGEELVQKSFNSYGEKLKTEREKGNLRMAPVTGIIGNMGAKIKNHNFYGSSEKE